MKETILLRPTNEIAKKLGLDSDNQVLSMADKHLVAVQGWLCSRSPRAESFEGIGVAVSSSGLPVGLLNLALGANYPSGIESEVIEEEIEMVKAFFARRRVPWYWWIGPFPQPKDMGERLSHHSLIYSSRLRAMAAPLPTSCPELNPCVKVWQAKERAELKIASRIRRIALQFPGNAGASYFEDMEEDWLKGTPAQLYLARWNEAPTAAMGALIEYRSCVGVYLMATLPQWERRGLGRGVLAHILSEAIRKGYRLIFLTASSKGESLYRQFGFEEIFRYHVIWSDWRNCSDNSQFF